jgi:hypothetical protein
MHSTERTFGQDVAFLKSHRDTIVLASADGQAKVAVVPSICGRVFTSTTNGDNGPSFGFLDDTVIASKTILPKINGYGGEDRFWLGPEGGQFAIFFEPGDRFTLDDWQTPAPIDTEAYCVVSQDAQSVVMTHNATFRNFSGFTFNTRIDRTVRLIASEQACRDLAVVPGGASCVAFETDNILTNVGNNTWSKETGMLSIWTLGMFKPSAQTVAVIPYVPGAASSHGIVVKDDYFGKVPAARLSTNERAIFFKADGLSRSKIGTSPRRSTPVCGSWDPSRNVLTIVRYTLPSGSHGYVNSAWEVQTEPFAGDVINSYNDGGTAEGNPTFYELETSSPALALKPGESGRHVSRTLHFAGPREDLDRICRAVLNVSLTEIESALP